MVLVRLFEFGLLLVIFLANLTGYGEAQELNKAALKYNLPDVYMWTSVSTYDPYVPLSRRQMMLSEYVVIHSSGGGDISIHIIYYDPKEADMSEQSTRKEYYWKFLNSTGVSPGATLYNTTFSVLVPFSARPNDVIAYHTIYRMSFETMYQRPSYDVTMEYPSNTGYIRRFISVVEYTSFPLVRWRYASGTGIHMRTWEEIVQNSMSLRPPNPSPINETEDSYHHVSPQDLRMLENPCARDLFAFYLVVQQRQDHSNFMIWGPLINVYISVPLNMGETAGPDWIDMTESFCLSYPDDCANIDGLVLTNAHLLAVSNRGIFVSQAMTSAPLRFLDYPDLPLLGFHLIDPCSQIRDLFYCYWESGMNPLIHSVRLDYVPVCYINQYPNFHDIVILVISHDTLDENDFLRNKLAWTVLYAEQPFTEWHLLVRSAIKFDEDLIHNLKASYYNHQLNHFDLVAQVGKEMDPTSAFISDDRWYIRFILPRPRKDQKPAYYDILSTQLGDGFLPKVFPRDFAFRKIEVSVGSLDIHFLGNQIWIAESGGRFVYMSVGYLDAEIEYCNFNHPDRFFICVNVHHTRVFVGKVSAYYRAHEIHVDDFPVMREIAIEEGWFITPSSRFDSKLTRIVSPAYSSIEGRVFEFLMRPILLKALKGVFYRVSYQGNIQIWYMESAIKYDQALLPDVPMVKFYEDAYSIVSGDGRNANNLNKTEIFEAANAEVARILPAFRQLFHEKVLAKTTLPCRIGIVNIRADHFLPFEPQSARSALVPFLIDGITVALYEARVPGTRIGFARTDVGNTINCQKRLPSGRFEPSCELYIRHIKFLDDSWLPGFSAVAYAYTLRSIPMHAYACPTEIHVNPRSNDAFLYILKDGLDGVCDNPAPADHYQQTDFIGWTFYVPGHFSFITSMPTEFTLNDENAYRIPPEKKGFVLFGKVTTTFDRSYELKLGRYEGFLINMASMEYQDYKIPPLPDSNISFEEQYRGLPAWSSRPSICLFELSLLPNPVLKSSGGVIPLDLHDSLSFSTTLHATERQGEVMMQQVRLKVSNSNPTILGVRQTLNKRITTQTLDITVKPTGFGTGQASVVVRALSCLPSCLTPCSLTFIFQIMRAEGRRLTIHYPIKVPPQEILKPDAQGNVHRNGTIIYMRLPVNYRPPSVHGVDIPISQYIYNSDPSQPMYRTTHKVSKVTGQYGKCRDRANRVECECSPSDLLQDHPHHTDCRQMVYKIRRGVLFTIRVTYAQLMEPAAQHQAFYLEKPHLVVWVEEVNGRQDYSLSSGPIPPEPEPNPYLTKINADYQLARGKRFYDADALHFVVYGTGLYHFRAALGEFDTFDDVSGYFIVYAEEFGLDDFSFMLFFFGAVMVCFLITLFAFLRVRNRLVGHIPRMREIVDDGKVKVD